MIQARPLLAISLLASSSFALGGCHSAPRTPVERGQSVFLRTCAGCHGQDARGTHPPGFATPPKDLTDPVLQAHMNDDAIRRTIREGNGQMPAFGAMLPEQDVSDVIAFVRTLKR